MTPSHCYWTGNHRFSKITNSAIHEINSLDYNMKMVCWIHVPCFLFQLISSCILLVNGHVQCRTDCACVPTGSPSPEDHCCLFINENLPPGSPVGNANDLPLIADFSADTFEFAPNNNELGTLFNFSETTGVIYHHSCYHRQRGHFCRG